MVRWMVVLLVSMLYISPVHASLNRKERPPANKPGSIKPLFSWSALVGKNDEYRITANTEVLLDGRPCRYDRVPDGARIILLETVTNKSKEISRIHFRSPRRPSSSTAK